MNSNIAYLIGVIQSDGCIYKFHDKKANRIRNRFRLVVSPKSLRMLLNVKDCFEKEFNRSIKISKNLRLGRTYYSLSLEFNKLAKKFQTLQIQKNFIPSWIVENKKLFFPYLAGLIDGDGSINIHRPSYPQCRIRITDGKSNKELLTLVEKYLNCKPWLEKIPNKNAYHHVFCVSPKNATVIKNELLPLLQLEHKKTKLENFIQTLDMN